MSLPEPEKCFYKGKPVTELTTEEMQEAIIESHISYLRLQDILNEIYELAGGEQ